MKTKEICIKEKIGRGYNAYWNFKGRYRVVKGSRASKKSKTTALWYIINMMKYRGANTLVVRKTFRTLKDSCFTELKWAIRTLGVDRFWNMKESPLEMTYIPTGQKIYFRGLDDPLKITSITVDIGALCWLRKVYFYLVNVVLYPYEIYKGEHINDFKKKGKKRFKKTAIPCYFKG